LPLFKAVVLRNDEILAWHKTPTTVDIQAGVELAIQQVIQKANIEPGQVTSVKIGTTVSVSGKFILAVASNDGSVLISFVAICQCSSRAQRQQT
jgi:hypothetical protein